MSPTVEPTAAPHDASSSVALELPDARERLAYISSLTERAADRVLSLVEDRQPACRDAGARARELSESLDRLASAPDLSLERARAMLRLCARFARDTADFAGAEQAALSDILMSQDFQDLSGQVIQKVVKLLQHAEAQLTGLVGPAAPVTPTDRPAANAAHELAGPQVPDKALAQGDVDDLLATLGF